MITANSTAVERINTYTSLGYRLLLEFSTIALWEISTATTLVADLHNKAMGNVSPSTLPGSDDLRDQTTLEAIVSLQLGPLFEFAGAEPHKSTRKDKKIRIQFDKSLIYLKTIKLRSQVNMFCKDIEPYCNPGYKGGSTMNQGLIGQAELGVRK